MTITAALFDLDGTLIDSLDDLTDAVNHMLAGFGRPQLDPQQVRQLIGKGARNLVQRSLASDSPDEIDRGLADFNDFNTLHIADKSRLYPGIPELLKRMNGNGITLAVISNKPEELSRKILKELHIGDLFDVIAGGDTFSEMKPSPLPLRTVIRELGCNPAETVMIGDSINDIQAGNRAGITTIGCRWGYGGPEELTGADFQADSPRDLLDIFDRIITAEPQKEA
jgi:phosphoglycolate phosphatase